MIQPMKLQIQKEKKKIEDTTEKTYTDLKKRKGQRKKDTRQSLKLTIPSNRANFASTSVTRN